MFRTVFAIAAALFCSIAFSASAQSLSEDWSGPLSTSFCNAPDFMTWCRFDTNFNLDMDGNPTGPKAWGPGTFDVSSGDLQLGTTGAVPILDPPLPEPKDPLFFDFADSGVLGLAWGPSFVDPAFGNGFVRTRVRVGENSTAGFGFRFDLAQFSLEPTVGQGAGLHHCGDALGVGRPGDLSHMLREIRQLPRLAVRDAVLERHEP